MRSICPKLASPAPKTGHFRVFDILRECVHCSQGSLLLENLFFGVADQIQTKCGTVYSTKFGYEATDLLKGACNYTEASKPPILMTRSLWLFRTRSRVPREMFV